MTGTSTAPTWRRLGGRAADRFQAWNRARKAAWLRAFIADNDVSTVLVVGSSGGAGRVAWENQVERALVDQVRVVVWSGINDAREPGYVRADGRRLPFRDKAFDLVFSNAVVEHVGDAIAQQEFTAEHRRVGRTWAMTTPNRWFPVESHTRTILRHWSPGWRQRQVLFTRLLSRRELRDLTDGTIIGSALSPTFTVHGRSAR